jgi:hypothetical protein
LDLGKREIMNKNKFFNKNSCFYKVLKALIVFFVAFNLIVFPAVIVDQSLGKPHAKAKVYMSAALIVDFVYIIFPSKIFGANNLISKPFYFVRNFLFNTGYELLPKSDAEKDLWWARIRFNEWYHLHLEPMAKLPIEDAEFRKIRFKIYRDVSWHYTRTNIALTRKMYYPTNSKGYTKPLKAMESL